jgi:hypothetical protein
MTQVARLSVKSGSLNDSFIMQLAVKKLGRTQLELEELSGRFVKGKRKGQLKAELQWVRCEVGGWNYAEQRVYRPGSFNYELVLPVYQGKPVILVKQPAIEKPEVNNKRSFLYIWDITTPNGNLSITTQLCNSVDVIASYAAKFAASECKALANWELMKKTYPNQYDN